jgi:protoheme IX farnesyltransferase
LGVVFLALAVRLFRAPEPVLAMKVFGWSITYLTLLFGAMAVDSLVFH